MEEVIYLFIGSLLALMSAWIIEGYKNKNQRRENSNNFKLLVKHELMFVLKSIEKLKYAFEYKNYFDYGILNELDKNISNLEKVRSDAVHLNSPGMQEKFIEIISASSALFQEFRAIQQVYDENLKNINEKRNLGLEDIRDEEQNLVRFFDNKSVEKRMVLLELGRKIEEYMKSL